MKFLACKIVNASVIKALANSIKKMRTNPNIGIRIISNTVFWKSGDAVFVQLLSC